MIKILGLLALVGVGVIAFSMYQAEKKSAPKINKDLE